MADVRPARTRDKGFTLVELLIVVAIVGVLTAAISNAIIAILRTNVGVTTRVDDNRDILALATWFPQDVNSTPASTGPGTGAELGDLPSGCAAVDEGTGLLRLTWTERVGHNAINSFRVSYRAVSADGATTIKRVACENLGVPVISSASKALPLRLDGTLPVTVSAAPAADGGTKYVLSVTQHPDTPEAKTVMIEAASKNPAIAELPPPPAAAAPPTMTFDAGTVDAGATVTANLALFQPGEVVSFFVDKVSTASPSIATATADGSGAASVSLMIPLSTTKGDHLVIAFGDSNGQAATTLTVNNATLTLQSPTVVAGQGLTVNVQGFDVDDVVAFLLDDLPVTGAAITVKQNNPATAVDIPPKTRGGLHVLAATGTSGRRAVIDFTVLPSMTLSPTLQEEGGSTSAVVYGFRSQEGITYTLDGTATLATSTADDDGYNEQLMTIPAPIGAGEHTIEARGDDGSQVSATITVTTAPRGYIVTPAEGVVTAGSNATFTLQATIDGVDDPSLNGSVAISVSGREASPNGTAPGAAPTTAEFTEGVATISVNLVNAAPTTITVADELRTGESTAVTVDAGAAETIEFAVDCPAPIKKKWTSGLIVVDAYGNPVSNAAVNMTFSPAVGDNTSIASLDFSGWTTVTPDAAYSSVTDTAGATPSFTGTGPKGNNQEPPVSVTASTNGRSVTCIVSS